MLKKNILSIDYEDWFTTSHYRNVVNENNKKYILEKPTLQLLDMLEKNSTSATFFILGQVAKDCPELIKKITAGGHEIASHGYSHTRLEQLTPEQFHEEIILTNKILEDITQKNITGFRAPFLSLNQQTAWAIDILEDTGFLYDSSIFPIKTPVYGVKNVPTYPYRIHSENIIEHSNKSKLIEFPISIYQKGPIKIPFAGGIYGRFLPEKVFSYFSHELQKKSFINFYVHPWELHDKTEITPHPGWRKNFLANYKSESYLLKIEKMIQRYNFSTFQNFLQTADEVKFSK